MVYHLKVFKVIIIKGHIETFINIKHFLILEETMKKYTETEEIRLSPSSINTYLKCPRQFFYSYIERLPQETTTHLIKGSVVHETLELFFSKYEKNMETKMDEFFLQVWKKYEQQWLELNLPEEETKKEIEDCRRILMMQVVLLQMKMDGLTEIGKASSKQDAFKKLSPRFKELWVEDKYLNLCGYIDRVDVDFNGNTKICDYKTSTKYGIGMPEDYRLQCGIYALLYFRQTGILPETVSINYLRYGEEPSVFVTPSLLKETLDKVQYVRERTGSRNIEDYPLKEQKLCKWCSFFGICSELDKVKQEERMAEMLKLQNRPKK